MPTVFSRIIAGEIPCYRIAEDVRFIAFLDIAPQRPGHVLIIPKTETDNLWDTPEDILRAWFMFAKPIAKAIEEAFPCNRCGIAVIGLEVPHAHMHLVPLNSAADLNFTTPKKPAAPQDLQEAQAKLLAVLINHRD